MNRPSVEPSIYISPRPLKSPDFDWEKSTLIITLSDSLDTNQTCVISVGTGAKDAHQNPLKQPHTFAFSTGATIDRGKASGAVLHTSFTGMTIWAYKTAKHILATPDSLVFLNKADYVTSVDEQGKFQLSYLAPGKYRFYAVIDQDQNEFYSSAVDYIGVPDREHELTLDSSEISGMLFHIMKEDTTTFAVSSIRAIDENTVLISFSLPLENMDSPEKGPVFLERFLITDLTTGDTLSVKDVYINTFHYLEIKILTDTLDSTHHYVVSARDIVSFRGDSLQAIKDTLKTFDFYQPEQASLEWILPEKNNMMIIPNDPVSVRFNKGISRDSWESNVMLESDSLKIPMGMWIWTLSGLAGYSHDTLFTPGKKFEFVIQPNTVLDWQNLALNDTLIRFSFMSYSPDSLGTVTGKFSSAISDGEARWYHLTLSNLVKEKRSYNKRLRAGQSFQFDYVIPGKYILEAYLDMNSDNRFNTGRVIPLEPPEPYRIYNDTISVRANWETTGIQFNFK